MGDDKKIYELPIDKVLPNRFQPRIMFDDSQIYELSESIKLHGVFSPIIVRKLGDKYEIIAGERRYKASVLAGKETIPAIISDANDDESIKIALLENVQRSNLSPLEEAISYKKISEMENMSQERLAKILGKTQATIANKLRLLKLSEEVQEALLENRISERHARSLLRIKNEQDQTKMLNKIITERLTVRKLDDVIDKYLKSNDGLEVVDLDLDSMDVDVPVNQDQVKNIEVEDIIMEEQNNNIYNNNKEMNSSNNNYEQNRFFNNVYNNPNELHADTPGNVNIFNTPNVVPAVEETPQNNSDSFNPFGTTQSEVTPEEQPATNIFENNLIEPVLEETPVVKSIEEVVTPVVAEQSVTPVETQMDDLEEIIPIIEDEPVVEENKSVDQIIQPLEENNTIIPEVPSSNDVSTVEQSEVETPIIEEQLTSPVATPVSSTEEPVITEIPSVLIDDIPTNEIIDEETNNTPSVTPEQSADINDIVQPTELKEEVVASVEAPLAEQKENATDEVETAEDKLQKALNMFRNDVVELKKLGYKIDIDEFDLETMYQLIIKVEK